MIAQRVGLSALRRGAARPAMFTQNVARLALSTSSPARSIATEKITANDEETLLAAQRKIRPLSPHMQIYDPKQTWLTPSIWTRITGGALAGSLYVYSTLYLVSPLLGWHVESSALVAAFASLPLVVKGLTKSLVAFPFVFHLFNGIRHLVYDVAIGFSRPEIKLWTKLIGAASVVATLALGFLY
ncbi:related to cytochrome b-large subunit [Cephalotrichum gorgonifer]|uniref:Related to cytochrome b-large subunit n=1 Tax=Cephalotrichum gorgonifer TaxID=2041049 RepID=A0AAE8N684_9PEZI|nr:related to cytochrome b-large subunit [Cephalotrichum gorgonifer]